MTPAVEETPLTAEALRAEPVTKVEALQPEPVSPKDDGLQPAVKATVSVALNYAARVMLPLCVQTLCSDKDDGTTCDSTQLISTATTGFFVGDLAAQLAAGPLVRALPGAQLLAISTAAWAAVAFTTPSALLSSPASLMLEQALFGLCCGLGYPSAHKLLGEARLKPQQRSTALSLVNSSAAWGSMAASLLTPIVSCDGVWGWNQHTAELPGISALCLDFVPRARVAGGAPLALAPPVLLRRALCPRRLVRAREQR